MNKQELKQEAIERMKLLKLHENIVREFQDEDVLNLSEQGILYWLDNEQKKYVKEFEDEHNAVVYHVIHDYTDFGEMLTFLFVSKYKEDWENDRNELMQGYAYVYVKNLDDDMCSECGGVGIRPQFGGIIRTA